MLKKLLSPLAGALLAGSAFSQEIFSFYFPADKEVSTAVLYNSPDSFDYETCLDFKRSKESFTDAYVRVLDDRVSTSKASMYRAIIDGKDYNLRGAMSRALADTVMEKYKIAIELKKFADDLKKKATIERKFKISSSDSNDSKDRPYKLILRPSVRGIKQNDVGLEFVLKDAEKDTLALARFYYDRTDLRVPIGNVFNIDEDQSWFNRFLKKVSLSARVRYINDFNGSIILSYESTWD